MASSEVALETFCGPDFDYQELKAQFKKHCPDFEEDLEEDKKSKAVEFCSHIIYDVIPYSRSLSRKKKTGDMSWKFKFTVNEDIHTVCVVTNMQNCLQYSDKHMTITVTQAELLALEIFTKLIPLMISGGVKILTPSAVAHFMKDTLPYLASKFNMTDKELLIALGFSTHYDRSYLESGDVDIVAARFVKDIWVRNNLMHSKLPK